MVRDYEFDHEVLAIALNDVLEAAESVFSARPDFREFTVKIEDDGIWVCLPDGGQRARPLPADLAD